MTRKVEFELPTAGASTLSFCQEMKIHLIKFSVIVLAACLVSCGPDYKKRFDTPLSYTQAIKEKDIDFPLPPSSHNINYAMYADWQAYQRFVRFEAPVEDCIRHIDAVIAWHNNMDKKYSSYPRTEVTSVRPRDGDQIMGPTPWFDVNRINHGLHTGKDSSHTPQIWVDRDRGVFYYYETD